MSSPDEQHNKFVLKERARLQAKEKELAKRETEFASLRDKHTELEMELKAKTGQLQQTAEMLRKRDEEREAARAAQQRAEQQLAQVQAAAAKAAAESGVGVAREAVAAAEKAAAAAEDEASTQREQAAASRKAADEARAALEESIRKLQQADEMLALREAALLEVQRGAALDAAALATAREQLAGQAQQLVDAGAAIDGLKQVISLALAKHLLLLQAIKRQQGQLAASATAMAEMEALRLRDEEALRALQEQVAKLQHEIEIKKALEAQLELMASDNAAKQSALHTLEEAHACQERTVSDMQAKLDESSAELAEWEGRCGRLQAQLDESVEANRKCDELVAQLEVRPVLPAPCSLLPALRSAR